LVCEFSLVVIGLVYKAYPDGCIVYIPAKAKALPREGHRLLCSSVTLLWVTKARTERGFAKP